MNIQNAGLSFKSLSNRSVTNRLILHHTEAITASPEQIHSWHLGNGWSGAGYHFYVRKNGSVFSLRPEWAVGAHASGSNSDSIGVCFEGNFMNEEMNSTQINAGKELIAYLKDKYGISKVQKHKDVCPTDCPGTNFPFNEIANGTDYSEVSNHEEYHSIAVSSDKLDVDGLWGRMTTAKMQSLFCGVQDGIVSGQLFAYKGNNPGLLSSSWEWNNGGGSPMVRSLQSKIGATPDGYFGTNSIKSLQNYLGTPVDGCISKPSMCVEELQKRLNNGTF